MSSTAPTPGWPRPLPSSGHHAMHRTEQHSTVSNLATGTVCDRDPTIERRRQGKPTKGHLPCSCALVRTHRISDHCNVSLPPCHSDTTLPPICSAIRTEPEHRRQRFEAVNCRAIRRSNAAVRYLLAVNCAVALRWTVRGAHHLFFGGAVRPTHWKWNHSMRQSALSQPTISPNETCMHVQF